jgi:hypothetical protein
MGETRNLQDAIAVTELLPYSQSVASWMIQIIRLDLYIGVYVFYFAYVEVLRL